MEGDKLLIGVIMFRSILVGAATVAVAAFVPQLPALAQNAADSAITVSAPAVRSAGSPADGVQQRRQLVATVAVHTGDLDLRTEYGRAMLDARILLAAEVACDRLDRIDPPSSLSRESSDCRHLAARSARPQIARAVLASG